jgi:hypothetical protein
MQLRYFVPFKAQEGVDAQYALKEKLLNIEGTAIDSSVNANKWQIPEEDLDFFVQSLQGAQLRVDHAESALMVVGKLTEAKRDGNRVLFRAEVGEEKLIEKILRNYVNHVSAQVDSDDVECSKCKKPTRKEGMLIHLCPGAYEIVHKPKVRELSIVASPAYKDTEFQPVGFFAAMNEDQWKAIVKRQDETSTIIQTLTNSQLSEDNKDVGSKPEGLQEPENKKSEAKKEVKPLSEQNAQAKASPHQAQGVVNVAPGETAPKQVEYQDLMNQVQQLEKQIREGPSASDAELDALKKKVAELESEIGKRATKRSLSKKVSELSKKLAEPEEGESGEAEAGEFPPKAEGAEAEAQKNAGKASGKGIVAVDEIQKDVLGNYDWFKDILKAHRMLQTQGFKG